MSIQQEKFKEIANAIRSKTGEMGLIKPADFADKVDEVYEAGKQSEYDNFWDVYQQNGERNDYKNAFGGLSWNATTFKPKYDINPTGSAYMMFANWGVQNLAQLIKNSGIKIDYSGVTQTTLMFYLGGISDVGTVDLTGASTLQQCFYGCYNLRNIHLILRETGNQSFSNPFYSNPELVTLTIEGVIGRNGFDVSGSTKLSPKSVSGIVKALKDYSGSSSTYTITLGTTNLAKLTNAEKVTATQKGWTLA